jgi:hypothetical protein
MQFGSAPASAQAPAVDAARVAGASIWSDPIPPSMPESAVALAAETAMGSPHGTKAGPSSKEAEYGSGDVAWSLASLRLGGTLARTRLGSAPTELSSADGKQYSLF